jgi:ABC-type branched-subunit amino acid transport system substrate-binding protein
MRSLVRAVVAVLAGCGLLVATSTTVASGASKYPPIPAGPITFGLSTPLSGATASYGIFTKLGMQVAQQAFNAEHPNGIEGHQVKIELLDDASDVTKAVQVANQLVSDKVAAVITASYNPAAAGQQLAVWAKAKMPVVSNLELPFLAAPKVLASKYPYLFSPNPSTQQTGVAAINWIKANKFKKVGILNDGIPEDTLVANQIAAGAKANKASVTTVNISPNSVDDSAAVTKLKGSGAQLLIVTAGEGYGPIWQAVLASGWSPTILASAGAWYSGFSSMGSLTAKAYASYYNCATSATQTFTATQQSLMAQYASTTSNLSINYLTFLATDSAPLELLDYAITKYNSTSPAAIKAALESIHNQTFLGLKYNFSPTNHYGLVGTFGPAVCHMGTPYAGGVGKVPVKA